MTYVALVGLTLILVRSVLFERLRGLWPALLECAQCSGFWVGAAAGASGVAVLGHGRAIDTILAGTATSFLSLLADGVLLKLLGDPKETPP